MDPAVATQQVRVAVHGPESAIDLALPVNVPVRTIIPRVRHLLAGGGEDEEVPARFRTEDLRPWTLSPLAGVPFSLDATLDTLGVSEGEPLLLCQLPPGPTAPPVIEDLADAAAIHGAARTRGFDPAVMLGPSAVVGGAAAGVVGSGLAAWVWRHGYPLAGQITLGVIAVAFMVGTAALRRGGADRASAAVGITAVVPLGLALAAALPGDAVAPRLVLAGAGVAAWALLLLVLTDRWRSTLTAGTAGGLAVAGAGVGRVAFDWPFRTLGCGLVVVSLLLAAKAPTLAPVFARFPFFYVPAPGEPTPPPLALTQIAALPRRSAAAQQFQAGMAAASVILTAVGSALVVWLPERPSWLCWWLVAVVGIITVLRLRLFHAATPALWFLSSPLLTAAALAVTFAATGHVVAAGWAGAALSVMVVVLIGLALLKPTGEMGIPQRSYLDRIEEGLLWTIYPTIVVLIGLVAFIRNRGWL